MRALRAGIALLVLLALAPGAGVRAAEAPAAAPDTLRVQAAIHPAVVKVGERVQVRFAVPVPDSTARLVGPVAPATFGDADVVVSEPAPAGPDSLGWRMEVALFEPGDRELSGIPFLLADGAERRPVRILPYSLTVESTLPDSARAANLRDIREPVPLPAAWRWGRIALALAVLGALAAGVVLWMRRPGREPVPVRAWEPSIPPEEEALAALQELEREELPARGRMKEHYARLSLILRTWVERRTPVTAVESTTDEIRDAFDRRPVLPREEAAALLALFDAADLVKFARHDPGPGPAGEALAAARSWVERAAARRAAAEARLRESGTAAVGASEGADGGAAGGARRGGTA